MGFYHFPFDCQNLAIVVRMPPDQPRERVKFVTKASISSQLRYFTTKQDQSSKVTLLAGWNVTGIDAYEAPFSLAREYNANFSDFNTSVADPLNTAYRLSMDQTPVPFDPYIELYGQISYYDDPGASTVKFPYISDPVSEGVFLIRIQRDPITYSAREISLAMLMSSPG